MHNSKAVVFFPTLIALLQLLLISFTTLTLVGMYTDPAASYASQLTAVKQTYASALEDASSTAGGLGANASRPVDSFFEALQDVDADRVLWYESLYLGFGFVWTYFFFAAIGTTTISGCVVYYFMDEDTP